MGRTTCIKALSWVNKRSALCDFPIVNVLRVRITHRSIITSHLVHLVRVRKQGENLGIRLATGLRNHPVKDIDQTLAAFNKISNYT